ncbi:MAG: MmcB family DNA repair protein [Pseudomonadota bacterium]
MFADLDIAAAKPGQIIARGVCRFLIDEGLAPVTEFSPASGLRTDVTALARDGEIWVVECKSSLADFRADAKWRGYLDYCDRFFFAVPGGFPEEVLPADEGLIFADAFGAEIARDAAARPMAAARRKAQTLRIARASAIRLRAGLDPGLAGLLARPAASSFGGEDEPGGQSLAGRGFDLEPGGDDSGEPHGVR